MKNASLGYMLFCLAACSAVEPAGEYLVDEHGKPIFGAGDEEGEHLWGPTWGVDDGD